MNMDKLFWIAMFFGIVWSLIAAFDEDFYRLVVVYCIWFITYYLLRINHKLMEVKKQ